MSQGSRLEVRAVICLNALVLAGETEPIIDKIEEQPLDMEKIRNMPGVTVYFVKPEDTLWDIARRFYTTVETIREQNSLDADEPAPGSPLLLAVHGSDL
jgi:LysM repeat protein